MKKPSMKHEYSAMLKELNAVTVTPEDLQKVEEECHNRREEGLAEDGDGIYIVASMFSHEPDKGQAIYFRMLALARVLDEENAPGWTLPTKKDGCVFTKTELVEAAAICPLSEIDGDIRFKVKDLLAKALELAEAEGTA